MSSNHRGVAAKIAFPRVVAQHETSRDARAKAERVGDVVVARPKQSADDGPGAKHVEEVAGHVRVIEVQRALAVANGARRGSPVRDAGDVGHRPRRPAEITEVTRVEREIG